MTDMGQTNTQPRLTTYAPHPAMRSPEFCQWSDAGGRHIVIRRFDNGELQLSFRGGSGITEEQPQHFAIAAPDVADFAETFSTWLSDLKREDA
jgi:hypothetical protein